MSERQRQRRKRKLTQGSPKPETVSIGRGRIVEAMPLSIMVELGGSGRTVRIPRLYLDYRASGLGKKRDTYELVVHKDFARAEGLASK